MTGSRYIYDLYYEKEAISKPLYDWLLKNNYADAILIAKWKKQGYEMASAEFLVSCALLILSSSFAVSAAFKPKRPILTARASVAFPVSN